jgi:hypothetical protein
MYSVSEEPCASIIRGDDRGDTLSITAENIYQIVWHHIPDENKIQGKK